MIISKLNDGKIAMMIENKEEAVELFTAFNREQTYAPENAYDIDEIAAETWPKIITEDDVGEDLEAGFLIWSDDFWEIIREYGPEVEALKNGEQMKV